MSKSSLYTRVRRFAFADRLSKDFISVHNKRFARASSKHWQALHTYRRTSMSAKQTDAELVQAACQKLSAVSKHSLVDIGVNLADTAYDKDRAEVVARARAAGVGVLVVTGCNLETSRKAQSITRDFQGLYFTAGIHPHNAKECDSSTLDALKELISDERCVAIGECGLDFNRNFSPPEVQELWFEEQVKLAVELQKPLFLHCRDAGERFAQILRQQVLSAPAVAHCFTGSKEELQEILDLGLHIGITGWICDERPDRGGQELANLLPSIPPDKLMIETDGPYLTPRTITSYSHTWLPELTYLVFEKHKTSFSDLLRATAMPSKARPRRNEPALLPFVLQKVALHLGLSEEQVAQQTTQTAKNFFGIRSTRGMK